MDNNNRVPLILFSGGLDSSYLLETMLRRGNVETMYVIGSQGQEKIDKERSVRKKIIRILEAKTGNKVLRDTEFEMKNMFGGYNYIPENKFSQPAMWLNGALHIANSGHAELLIAYVMGDQICSFVKDIEQAWNSLQAFTKHFPIPVRFPFLTTTKQDILDNIDPRVVQNVWICELPYNRDHELRACGNCAACLTIFGQLQIWKKRHGYDYSKEVIRRLNTPPSETFALTESVLEDSKQMWR